MSKRLGGIAGSIALTSLLAVSVAPRMAQARTAQASATVTIGVSVPLLQLPALAKGIENGVSVAVAQANASHTVPGVTFKANTLDDTLNNAYSPQKDAANARSFIADPTTIGEIGPLNSGAAKGSAAVYNNAGMVQISPANSAVDLTAPSSRAKYEPRTAAGKGPITYFRTVTTDAYQGPEDALYAKNVLHAKRVFVVDNTGAYGVGLAQSFAAEAKKIGMTVVGTSELDTSQPKLGTDQVAKNIANASGRKLDLVFFGGEYDNTTGGGTYLADALKANGLKMYIMGGDGIFDPAFIKGSSNGGVLTGYASNIGPNPAVYPPAASYLAAAQKMFPGVAVSSYDIESYDAANVIIAAYAKALKSGQLKVGQAQNITTRTAIAKLVGQTKNFKGASGTFSFDANGDTTNRIISIYKVSGSGKSATWVYAGLAPKL
jgi:branched-chain amino acid transport system substrate-binding protein